MGRQIFIQQTNNHNDNNSLNLLLAKIIEMGTVENAKKLCEIMLAEPPIFAIVR